MSRNLSVRMLAGLAAGILLGVGAHLAFGGSPALETFLRNVTEPAGTIFLRLLFMLVIPLVVSGLALGVAGLGDIGHLGRVGLKTLVYTVVVSTIAVLIGVGLVNLVKPGAGLSPEIKSRLAAHATITATAPPPAPGATAVDFLVHLVPSNIVKAMADGDLL